MKYSPPLKQAVLLRRYKRFLADVILDGQELTVHCANTGSMTHCVVEGSPCWLWDSQNDKRKYRYTWELATTTSGAIAGINTGRANTLVEEAISAGRIAPLAHYQNHKREVKVGSSRIDFVLSGGGPECYLEVKSVTLGVGGGLGLFPDTKSERATKHLKELVQLKQEGKRAVLLFCVQHTAIDRVEAAKDIDPVYASTLAQARLNGVEVLAYRCDISSEENRLMRAIEVL
ncbi:MAG: DNA/RNA nuclease SfsA [Agarilytica sp.]